MPTGTGTNTLSPRGRLVARLHWVPGIRPAIQKARSAGLRMGVVPYRARVWRREGETVLLDKIAGLEELGRYSVLVGYLDYFCPERGPEILDVGCGKGRLRSHMRAVNFTSYLGIDRSPEGVAAALPMADERTRFVVGDVMTAELGDFDVVVCNEVLNYFDDPSAVLDRIRTLLRPGGLLLTSLWRQDVDQYLWRLVDERFELLDRVYIRNPAIEVGRRGWRVACHQRL